MVEWHADPVDRDYDAAQDYLELTFRPEQAEQIVRNLRRGETVTKRAKDIIRSSRLPVLTIDNAHVRHNIERMEAGEKLAPILLVRGEPLIVADGYHRACAIYLHSEDTEVRCRVADRDAPANEAAREAYLAGWHRHGAEMTARGEAGAAAAVEHAVEHAGDDGILEVTLQLGSLEGTWARIYERRLALYDEHTAAVVKAWQAWVDGLDVDGLVAMYRRDAGIDEADDPDEHRRKREEAAVAAALLFLRRLAKDTDDEHFLAMLDTVTDALRAGEAEGQAGAIALAAQQLGHTSVDFDAAYQDALDALQDAERFDKQAHTAVDSIIAGAAADIGRRLARSSDDDAEDQAAAVDDESQQGHAAAYFTDLGMGLAFTAGMAGVFAAVGLNTVNFVTAGDGRVCPICQGYEDQNPWPLLTVPHPAIHGRCRCTLEPAGPIVALGRFAKYVLGDE